jgi:hypothetical protein
MAELTIYSDTAWSIASRYSHVLASETRDLAAHIDFALNAQRERHAKIAERMIEAVTPPCTDGDTFDSDEITDARNTRSKRIANEIRSQPI